VLLPGAPAVVACIEGMARGFITRGVGGADIHLE